jgi:C4-dicarboxylate transporter, DctM subunit
MNSVGTLWIFALMFLICADVAGRYLFNAPIKGAAELVGYSIVTAVFLQMASTLRVGRFTRVEMLFEPMLRQRPAAAQSFEVVFSLMGAAVFLVITWGTWPKLAGAWTNDEITGTPGVFVFVIWPFLAVIVFGAAVTAMEFALQVMQAAGRAAAAWRLPPRGTQSGWPPIAIALAALAAIAATVTVFDLSNLQIGVMGVACMVVFILGGLPIGIVMIVTGFAGIWLIRGDASLAMRTLSQSSTEYLNSYFFGVVPLYVLMGLLVSVSDVGKDTFVVARWLLRRVRGGLGVATVAANAVFAAVTGSSIASAAVFTKIAAPEMLRHGYTPRFSVGVVAGSSVLGMLIPPSLLFIVYGFLAEQSVGHLFLAGIVPGLILAAAFSLQIVLMATFWPAQVGGQRVEAHETENVRSAALKLAPILALIAIVLGGIYGGIFTPTESGAAGALGALVIALVRRKLSWRGLWDTMVETGYVTVSILFLILGARVFAQMLAMSNLPQQLSALAAAANLGLTGFVALYIALVIVLGCMLDSVSIMVITLPFAIPVVKALGGDLIWFGVVAVVAIEIGLLTPPFGISVYVVKSTLDDQRITLHEIFAGAFPFVVVMALVTLLLLCMPALSLVFK